MIDAFGNELHVGDLVAFAKPTGSNARMHLAVVVDTTRKAIFSMYTYYYKNELQQVYNSRPGYNVSQYKLLQFDPANDDLMNDIHDQLNVRARKWQKVN